jgi:hypothetical protein
VARLALTERIRASPYHPALVHPVFRRILPGAAASALGDGMSAVAIAWLALKLAPAGSRGLWVGAAVAAYTLPGAVGAIALRRWLSGRHGTGLVIVNAVLRAVALGVVGCLALAGLLDPPAYVALLGASSLLTAWGVAGKYTLIADLFPADQRVAGNTVFSLADQTSLMIGPALAGVVTALAGPAIVITLDAASWALLAASYASAARLLRTASPPVPLPPDTPPTPDAPPAPHTPPGGWALIRSVPVLAGLLALSFVFYLLYGPLEVALPVHVATDLHGSAALLGIYWAVFGVGAIIGELSAPFLRRWPVWPTMTGIVLARGCPCPWGSSRTPARPARWPRSSRPAAPCSSWPDRSAPPSAAPSSPPSAPAAPSSFPPWPPSPSPSSPPPSWPGLAPVPSGAPGPLPGVKARLDHDRERRGSASRPLQASFMLAG